MAPPNTSAWTPVDESAWQPVPEDAPAAPVAAPPQPNMLQKFQQAVDLAASPQPLEPGMSAWPQRIASGMVRDVLQPLAHPIQTAESIAKTNVLSPVFDPKAMMQAIPGRATYEEGKQIGFGPAIERTLGGFGAGVGLSGAIEPTTAAARLLRDTAVGDPNAAALRGLQVSPKSPKSLGTIRAVENARPYLHGVRDLSDLQARVPIAKDEVWTPYRQALDAIGDKSVQGPDGMTTVRTLEDERQQLSALNRGLKQQNPESIQLAQQKGMTQAQLLEREKSVVRALDPHLAATGIDPAGIRGRFGSIAQVGQRVSGKSTILEQPQPTGFGRINPLKFNLHEPLQTIREVPQMARDLIAGRPLFSAKPTDLGIREGFSPRASKPDLGYVRTTTAPPPSRVFVTPPPSMESRGLTLGDGQPLVRLPQLPASTGAGQTEPMIGIRVPQHPGVADEFARTRIVPSKGQLNRIGGTTLPPETSGLALPSGPTPRLLPAFSGGGEPQPMIGIRSDYPMLQKAFAKERVPPTVFDRPTNIENPLFRVGENGEAIPTRRELPAPAAKPKRATR